VFVIDQLVVHLGAQPAKEGNEPATRKAARKGDLLLASIQPNDTPQEQRKPTSSRESSRLPVTSADPLRYGGGSSEPSAVRMWL